MATRVQPFTPDDWELLRALRLRALADAPHAFGSTHAREVDFGEAVWQERTSRMAYATHDAAPAGIVGAGLPDDDTVELTSMWVAPEFRRLGVGGALVGWVVTRARRSGRRRVGLWYAEGNDGARRLYARFGFVATGEREALASRPEACEHRMVLTLTRATPPAIEEAVVPVLRVDDAARAVAWYARLDFEQQWEHQVEAGFPWFVCVARGRVRLYLSEHEGDACPNTLLHLDVLNIDEIAAEFGETVHEQGLAGREVHLVDPDGNRLRVATPPR